MILASLSVWLLVGGALLLSWIVQHLLKPAQHLPPGPKGLPIVGSLFDINNERPWITYGQWSREYGMFP